MKKKLFYSFLSVLFVSLTIFLTISNQGKKVLVKKCKDLSYQDSYKLHQSFFSRYHWNKIFTWKAWRRSLFKSEINAKNNQKVHNVKFYERSARTDAVITVKVDENIFCNLKARIRLKGLFDDHRDGTSILPGLNVELKDGNIFGITKFYLFRPKTRAYNNEIISSLIFKHSGFLSLRVTKAHVKYNNQKIEYILQEDTAKEFLEINRLKDAPIYEGTSKNYLKVKDVAGGYKYDFWKHRIINEKWSTKSDNHMNMSKTGLSILNEFMNNYVANRQIYGQGLNADYRSYEKKFLKTKYFEKFATFDALTYAARADHSLSINDRIYYYDILNNNFIPIHWDGMSHLVDRFNNVIAENLYNVTYTQSIKDGSKRGLELIKKIDLDKLDQSFKLHGVSLKKKDYKKIFQIIEENLKRFSVLPDEEIVSLKQIELKKKI